MGLVKDIIKLIVTLISYAYSYKTHEWIKNKRNAIYSMWIQNFLGEVGVKTRFERPILLQGGGARRIKIGSNTGIGHHTVLGCWVRYGNKDYKMPEIIIGNNCSIGEYCHITAINKITIGDGLLTGRFVYIGDNAHGELSWDNANIPPAKRNLTSKGEINIGRDVWIGDKVSICDGVTIGDNVIVGANSVVTHNVPSNCVIAGSPAKVVKSL